MDRMNALVGKLWVSHRLEPIARDRPKAPIPLCDHAPVVQREEGQRSVDRQLDRHANELPGEAVIEGEPAAAAHPDPPGAVFDDAVIGSGETDVVPVEAAPEPRDAPEVFELLSRGFVARIGQMGLRSCALLLERFSWSKSPALSGEQAGDRGQEEECDGEELPGRIHLGNATPPLLSVHRLTCCRRCGFRRHC
jgi:hypothetical protein